MLESWVAWVVNSYVGEYVGLEYLNTDQLSVALYHGSVVLENLPLRKDALRKLDLPIEVKSGFIGHLTIRIPITNIATAPWEIQIKKLYLVAGAQPNPQFDEEEAKTSDLENKKKQLAALEDQWKAQHHQQQSYSFWYSIGSSLLNKAITNIQINIEDVHIRYEDSSSLPGTTFALGITMDKFSLASTDQKWTQKYPTKETPDVVRKLGKLEGFAVYWDTEADPLGDVTPAQLEEELRKARTKAEAPDVHSYIICPVSAEARVWQNHSPLPLRSRAMPRFQCEIQLEDLPINLNQTQFKCMMGLLREFDRYSLARKYRKGRPTVPVIRNCRQWWQFAIRCHLQTVQQRHHRASWQYVLQRARDNVQYVDLYSVHLTSPQTLSEEDKATMDRTESELSIDELRILVEIAMERCQGQMATQTDSQAAAPTPGDGQQQAWGYMSSWFPGWAQWYTSPQGQTVQEDLRKQVSQEIEPIIDEEEILALVVDSAADNTLLRRDLVFARLDFCLKKGSVTLLQAPSDAERSKVKPILEMSCSAISLGMELRPRFSSNLLTISLGALRVQDRTTEDTIFPCLLAPQCTEGSQGVPRQFGVYSRAGPSSYLQQTVSKPSTDDPLFNLVYEQKPLRSQADHRLEVTSRAMVIVYNSTAMHKIAEFFRSPHKSPGLRSQPSETQLTQLAALARTRYEQLKTQTQAEIRQTLDQLLEGESQGRSAVWDVRLDISAPQFLVPQSFTDKNATMVVFDFGHLSFSNHKDKPDEQKDSMESDIDEEDFVTPLSTPAATPPTEPVTLERFVSVQQEDLSEQALHEKLYERYKVGFSDLQVMVVKGRDNWRHAHSKGTSHMHVIDRFSISLRMERRLVYTSDPQWPSVTLAGNLPKLGLHVSEQKVHALLACMKALGGDEPSTPSPDLDPVDLPSDMSTASTLQATLDLSRSPSKAEKTGSEVMREILEESRLLLTEFSVDSMSVDVQSRSRSVAELQVASVQACITKRPYDTSMTLTVHSMLLVDALQTFGPDFELLVASHKDLCMDVHGGSMVDSDHASSPRSSQDGSTQASDRASSPATVADRTTSPPPGSLGTSPPNLTSDSPFDLSTSALSDTDALITMEFTQINPDCPTLVNGNGGPRQIASLQFNTLDVIANPETVMELLGFFQRVVPKDRVADTKPIPEEDVWSEDSAPQSDLLSSKTQITADFNRLNILVLRAVPSGHRNVGYKVATATMSGAHVMTTLGGEKEVEVEGSLDGLQFLDLTPEGSRHKKVFTMGHDPTSLQASLPDRGQEAMQLENASFITACGSSVFQDFTTNKPKALHFTLTPSDPQPLNPPLSTSTPGPSVLPEHLTADSDSLRLQLRLASACYTHSPRLLQDLSLCADQFTQYTATWANSLRSAASEMALSFVKKSDPLSMSVGPTGLWDSSRRLSRTGSFRGLNRADSLQQINRDHKPGLLKFESLDVLEDLMGEAETPARRLELDIVLQTPIVVLPRSQHSQDKMVAHLGQISIHNTRSLLPDLSTPAKVDSGAEHFHVEIRDMNMYSFNDEQQNRSRTSSATSINLSSLQEPSMPDCSQYMMTDRGTPILHNTTLQLTLVKGTVPRPETDGTDTPNQSAPAASNTTLTDEEQNPCLKVSGKLVSPLKLVLSKSVYEQVMETVDNLTVNNTPGPGETQPEEKTQAEVVEEEGSTTSVSALKLEEPLFKKDRMGSAAENGGAVEEGDPPMVVHGSFDMPELVVQLSGDLSDGEQGLVDLSFQNLKATYVKDSPHTTSIKISLRGLLMEDLLQPADSKHRQLMVSYPKRRTKTQSVSRGQPVYISTSLPTHPHLLEHVHMPSSLPATLDSNMREYVEVPSYPATPPPSPQRTRSHENVSEEETEESLVYINILLVDKNSPEFATKYNRVNRFVDVDFSCLDTTINLQTWVVLLDFFGIGSPKEPAPSPSAAGPGEPEMAEGSAVSPDAPEQVNTEVEVKVRSLSLLLNKPEYELAKANVAQLSARVSLVDGNMAVTGNLGSMSVLDLTPHGALYRERFVTSGKEALDFNIFRYGLPDPDLQREYDIRVRLRMSSVRYVLTQRFQAETVAFCQHFKHLQELLGTMRAATSGQKVNEAPGHAARILMDISAGAPVILFPESSRSSNILVMNLGHLTVSNQFLFAGDRGTIEGDKQWDAAHQPNEDPSHDAQQGSSVVYTVQDGLLGTLSPPEVSPAHKCLLDCMEVELLQMDLYSAERVDWYRSGNDAEDTLIFPSFMVERKGGHPLQERCVLKLRVERNLDGEISHDVPDFNILGMLSSVYCSLDLNQYQLVRGVLHCNLGEPLEEFERPPTATQEPSIQTVLSGNVWTGMSIHIDLVNVSMELLLSHAQQDKPAQSLARFEFIRSKLSYESFSDMSKDVDLVSHAIVAHDTRFKDQPANLRPNVFEQVLEPSLQYHQQGALQMELHYRSTKDFTRFTILLNNMRLMVIFDWLSAVKDFLLTDHQEAQGEPHGTDDFSPPSPQPSQPVNVTQGVVTKRGPPPKPEPSMTEIKLNVTQTEFVVVESTASWDTNAIILKSTAVLTYRPQMIARPVSCSLQSLEVFSCQLGNEQDTALSIIDPLTVNIELKPSANQPQAGGLLDATALPDLPPMLEVVFHTLNIRVSYHDIRLFLAILNSLPKQTSSTANHNGAPADPQQKGVMVKGGMSKGAGRVDEGRNSRQVKGPMEEIDMVQKLQELGFAADDCRQALQQCDNRLNMAAAWLLENAEPVPQKRRAASGDRQGLQEGGMRLSGIMVTANCACLCLIDDCKDSDVPLAEVALHDLMFVQYLEGLVKGSLNCALTVDYYNRELSGWEPLVEPWNSWFFYSNEFGSDEETKRSQFGLTKQPVSDVQPSALQVRITAEDRLNLNITSSFLDQYSSTQKNWTEDYLNGQTVSGAAPVRRRSPFVPYMLRNHTGCRLAFATQTTSSSRAETLGSHGRQSSDKDSLLSDWHQVMPGEDVPFEFEGRGKLRHRHTHELRVHQLLVQVEGWHQVSPVSVDRVGVYFRDAQPLRAKAETIFHDLPPARIVFAVTMVEGSAQKVVTVRSALVIKSMLEVPTELKLDNPSVPDGPIQLPVLEPNSSISIPLPLVSWRLYARPRDWGVQFCRKPLEWMKVLKGGERLDSMRECSAGDEGGTYRFCVSVRREHFPPDVAGLLQTGPGASQRNVDIVRRPGHVIRLLPPVVLTNLLPVELSFYLKGTDIRGTVKAGKSSALYNVDTTQTLELGVLLESFTECRELVIPLAGMSTIDHKVKLRLHDTRNRPLHLYVRLKANPGGTLRILISAPYWLINKTGLPLIFKQEGMRGEAAGQFDEHELARSLAPLLFSYTDKENPDMCTMRLGTAVHTDGMSSWCQRLSLEGGTGVRQLYVVRHGGHPSIVYNIGIDIRRGRGRYHATRIVTFAPRYILDNRTEHKLAFAQRHLARGMRTSNPDGYLSALPKANVLFHWPRVDLDMLLCVRIMDVPDCCWSGGFSIERIGSFHVNMRGNNCRCIFLHAEIVQHGATFCVVFTDPTGLPPPYRIDNHAEVPIVFWQKDSVDDSLRTEMKPHTSMAYARDELMLPSVLVCQVKGGSYAYYNMNRFGDGDQLCYENFIYIAFTETFRSQQDADQWADKAAMASRELVLDVPSGTAVVLRKKEPGKRSQLWRMTSAGLLRHEGSSPPRHPGSSTAPSKAMDGLVLDITDIAANPLKFITLCLRKPDQRRKATQTWNFTEDGRMCCLHTGLCVQAKFPGLGTAFKDGRLCCLLGGLCVQAKDGMVGLRHSAAAVLGPVGITQPGYIPPGQRVTRQKVQPGSGVLACRIVSDGPTRVLQITDINQKRLQQSTVEDWVVVQDQTKAQPLATSAPQPLPSDPSSHDLELEVMLKGGVGISLVNRTPEELAFVSLCGISVSYSATASRESLIATVNKIQVDNQLSGSCWPVMLHMAHCGLEAQRERPAVHMAVEKEPGTRQDTEIYKHLMLHVSPLVLQLEESGLLKLLQFFGFGSSAAEMERVDVAEFDSWRNHTAATTAKRYYFETLKLHPTEMKLSVNRGAKLPPDLKALKARLGLTLISFQEATVDLDAFTCLHAFETRQFLIDCIYSHYIEELKGQAAKILGSVDFLGNPIGLFNDVTDGLSGLVQHGNVSGLFRNVTHGLSNSAAKMTSALSDGLGNIALDSQHQQTRTQIRQHGGSGSEHIVAGLKGLGFGIVGGLTSLVTQTAEGAVKGGVEGFFSGLGKGLVGTVTRPATGLLDFASGTALAVRDTAASDDASRLQPRRVRLPRCCSGPGGTLPRYTDFHSQGQDYLYKLNDMNTREMFISLEQLRHSNRDFLQGLVSSEAVYFLGRGGPDPEAIILQVNYSDLFHCIAIKRIAEQTGEERHYVEVTMKADNLAGVPTPSQNPQKRPVVRCDSKDIAEKVVKQIMYAKSLYDEHRLTLPPSKEEDPLDWDY
ncbi:intermembrane lipid transfer protein VPS13D-like isoform X3 [Branchiostoma floridae x Branchiostoma japonicum]